MVDTKITREKAKQLHEQGKLGQFGCASNFCLYRIAGEDILRGVYKCKACSYEEQNVEIAEWEKMSKKGLKCPKCKEVIWKPSALIRRGGKKKK